MLALAYKPIIEAKAKENLVAGAAMTNTGCQKSDKAITPIDTKKELAKIAGVSRDTIETAQHDRDSANEADSGRSRCKATF